MVALFLISDSHAADVTSELARCQLEAERLHPALHNSDAQNWPAEADRQHRNVQVGRRLYSYGRMLYSAEDL